MAGPLVHITNGIPDVGTGNVLTLDQVVYAQGANLTTGGGVTGTPGPLQGPLAQGAATTSAPTYVNGTANPLSLDLSGNLRCVIPGSVAVTGTFWQATQPVSIAAAVTVQQATAANLNATVVGTVTANIGTTGALALESGGNLASIKTDVDNLNLTQGASTTGQKGNLGFGAVTSAAPAYTTATSSPLSLTLAGALRVDGSATTQPVSGNVGISGNVNCVQVTSPWVTSVSGSVTCVQSGNWTSRCVGNSGNAFDFPSTQNVATPAAAVLIGGEFNASPTSITTGNSSPLQLDSVGSLLVNVKTSTNINAVQSGTWTDRIVGSTGVALDAAQGAAAPANELVVGGVYNSTQPTLTTGNASQLQVDSNGNLRVNIMAGAGSGGTASTVGGALPGQGTLAMGSVTTAAPAYTTATANALSLTTAGALRVDGSAVTQPVSGTFWQATQPVSIAATVSVNPGTIGNWGLSPSTYNTTTPTNAMSVEGQYNSTQAAMTSGNSSVLQTDKVGRLLAVGALRTTKGVQKTSITNNTSNTVTPAGGAGVFIDVYAIVVTNKSATSVFIDFNDGLGVRMTLAAPANDTRGFTVPVDSAIAQSGAATAWTATASAAVTSLEVTVLYVQNL